MEQDFPGKKLKLNIKRGSQTVFYIYEFNNKVYLRQFKPLWPDLFVYLCNSLDIY